jgi:hypothetical protein
MNKQIAHKVLAITLLLVMFSVPFYNERNQIAPFNDSTYLVGGVFSSGKILSSQLSQKTPINSQAAGWARTTGDTFIGLQTK